MRRVIQDLEPALGGCVTPQNAPTQDLSPARRIGTPAFVPEQSGAHSVISIESAAATSNYCSRFREVIHASCQYHPGPGAIAPWGDAQKEGSQEHNPVGPATAKVGSGVPHSPDLTGLLRKWQRDKVIASDSADRCYGLGAPDAGPGLGGAWCCVSTRLALPASLPAGPWFAG